mmetsp:Transcript_79385/g.256642  ORF Transcript_79385/g.256642 Transcript_79385/m.256642 type:complete len:305 (-) Transcript_79385:166-1080(-)
MPAILAQLPARSDDAALPVGVWGYCIGGLAAWNALVSRPDLFNIAYLGSPAMDFNCGHPFDAIRGMSWTAGARPRIYIDAGTEEGELMDKQTLLLFQKLQDKGLVAGQDVFYERAEFGTHQESSFLRRSVKALLVLFGANSAAARRARTCSFGCCPPRHGRERGYTIVGRFTTCQERASSWPHVGMGMLRWCDVFSGSPQHVSLDARLCVRQFTVAFRHDLMTCTAALWQPLLKHLFYLIWPLALICHVLFKPEGIHVEVCINVMSPIVFPFMISRDFATFCEDASCWPRLDMFRWSLGPLHHG